MARPIAEKKKKKVADVAKPVEKTTWPQPPTSSARPQKPSPNSVVLLSNAFDLLDEDCGLAAIVDNKQDKKFLSVEKKRLEASSKNSDGRRKQKNSEGSRKENKNGSLRRKEKKEKKKLGEKKGEDQQEKQVAAAAPIEDKEFFTLKEYEERKNKKVDAASSEVQSSEVQTEKMDQTQQRRYDDGGQRGYNDDGGQRRYDDGGERRYENGDQRRRYENGGQRSQAPVPNPKPEVSFSLVDSDFPTLGKQSPAAVAKKATL